MKAVVRVANHSDATPSAAMRVGSSLIPVVYHQFFDPFEMSGVEGSERQLMHQSRCRNVQVAVVQHLVAPTQLGLEFGRFKGDDIVNGKDSPNGGQYPIDASGLMVRIAAAVGAKIQFSEGNDANTRRKRPFK